MFSLVVLILEVEYFYAKVRNASSFHSLCQRQLSQPSPLVDAPVENCRRDFRDWLGLHEPFTAKVERLLPVAPLLVRHVQKIHVVGCRA